ncbi:MAG: zf-HC2 domain-containing protein [Planctomycetes bacterium]|nr:zf-HC2 domain-containing protein [Planctomycetota bacterium]
MTCREFAEFLDAFLAGTLLAEEMAAFHRHLAVCVHCVTYLDTYRRTVDACRRLGATGEDVPAEVPEELVQAILASRRKQA